MERLDSFVCDRWVSPSEEGAQPLVNPATEETLALASTSGLALGEAVAFAREQGGPALRALTFGERGELLRAMAKVIHQHRDALLDVGMQNGGTTRGDTKFDLDGASGTLAYYGELGVKLGAARFLVDGEADKLGRGARFYGEHAWLPRVGVAAHVNAFNFPAWGFGEKAATALLAGMPIVVKPATSTALLAHRVAKLVTEAKILPAGALTFVTGPAGDLLTHLGAMDVLAFTGSADTAARLRQLPAALHRSLRLNVEADSLNAAVLCADVAQGSDTWSLFVKDVVRDMTQKTGQKCTATRRVLVPAERLADLEAELVERLAEVRVGDPSTDGVTMGPVATAQQLRDVRAGIGRLAEEAQVVTGSQPLTPLGAPAGKGYFVAPTLLTLREGSRGDAVHSLEVFGPVATLVPYRSTAELVSLVARGDGSLVTSIYTDDRELAGALVLAVGPYVGRLVLGSEKIADQMVGPGTVLPQSVHGGPGRAGGGEELGGLRGLALYSQRVAVQGARPMLDAITSSAARIGAAAASPTPAKGAG
jgi:3,4-dehydroadipyl-CoA semialdehyde dehydrogenase